MTLQQELSSWFSPSNNTAETAPPAIGSAAPTHPKLQLGETGKPTIIAFLRHCGCPFAEKTFLNLRDTAKENKSYKFIAISHSDQTSTDGWLKSLPQAGSEPPNLQVVIDEKTDIYAAWGLGVSGYAHALSPWSLYEVWKLGRDEGIWNRPTESGSRWQISGAFAVDGNDIVRWGDAADRADDVPDFDEAINALASARVEKL